MTKRINNPNGRPPAQIINGRKAVEIAVQNGINKPAYYARVRRGYTLEQATTQKQITNPIVLWIVDGKKFESANKLGKYLGMSKGKILGRYNRLANPEQFELDGKTIRALRNETTDLWKAILYTNNKRTKTVIGESFDQVYEEIRALIVPGPKVTITIKGPKK